MQLESLTRRWLILEHGANSPEWGAPPDAGGLIVNESGVRLQRPEVSHVPSETEVAVLFLTEQHAGPILAPCFDNRVDRCWNVWCHYGGDIDLMELPDHWKRYERLCEPDKAMLLRDAGDFPRPFSIGQEMRWTTEFSSLKAGVKAGVHETAGSRALLDTVVESCVFFLQRAWLQADSSIGVDQRVRQNKEVLPALLASQYVRAILSERGPDSSAILEAALRAVRTSGLVEASDSKDAFSAGLRQSYRKLLHSVLGAKNALTQNRKTEAHLELLVDSLDEFISLGISDAQATTKELKSNPRKPVVKR